LFTETTDLKGKSRLPQISMKLTYYVTYLDFPMMIKTKQQIVSLRNKLKNQKREYVVELIDFRPL
jgi:hypothetical protein